MISEGLPRALIEEWPDDVMEVLIEQAREADCVSAWGPDADRRRKYLI
jgi:hypothetical protein